MRVVDKPAPRTAGPISFQKQLNRRGYAIFDVNEKRFEGFNDRPAVHTKTRRISTPDFSRGLGHRYEITPVVNSAIYSPNHSQILTDTSKPTLSFTKSPPRKPLNNPVLVDSAYYKVSFSQIDKDQPFVDLSKSLPRPNDTHFPSFMIRNTSRHGLDIITEKSLETNYFSNGKFFEYESDFGKSCPNSPKRFSPSRNGSMSMATSPIKNRNISLQL